VGSASPLLRAGPERPRHSRGEPLSGTRKIEYDERFTDPKSLENKPYQGASAMIKEGTQAPGFKLKDHLGREISLEQLKGKRNLMLLFYPLDWTPT